MFWFARKILLIGSSKSDLEINGKAKNSKDSRTLWYIFYWKAAHIGAMDRRIGGCDKSCWQAFEQSVLRSPTKREPRFEIDNI